MRYDVIAPQEMRGPLQLNEGTPTDRDGIEYELFIADGQAVILFINRTPTPIRLVEASTLTDATGRSFVVESQSLAVGQSGRVILPPAIAAEQISPRRSAPIDIEPRVGGVDEGGMVTRERLSGQETTDDPRGFRWRDGQTARAHLVFEPQRDATTAPAAGTITHDFVLTKSTHQ